MADDRRVGGDALDPKGSDSVAAQRRRSRPAPVHPHTFRNRCVKSSTSKLSLMRLSVSISICNTAVYLTFVLGSPPIREFVADLVKTMTYPNLPFGIYSQ